MSIVRKNLLNVEGYTPHCGNDSCLSLVKTFFNGEQFECSCCGWRSRFEKEFIEEYKEKQKEIK